MCGIFGYVGRQRKETVALSLQGLKRLEYRGYDSAGIAGLCDGTLLHKKVKGKVADLQCNVGDLQLDIAIAHTRWATHGKPSILNAHPHLDTAETLAIVHNGIIENHDALRSKLMAQGIEFQSETDTEVMAQLISSLYRGDILQAVQEAMPLLEGALAIAVIHKDHPEQIIAATRQSPLAIGIGNGEAFIASDTNAFLVHTNDVVFLTDSEVARITPDGFEIYDETAEQVLRETERIEARTEAASKGEYDHFMLKEIYEQPQTIRNALLSRYIEQAGTAKFDELDPKTLQGVRRILVLACGTSYHAGLVASYLIEQQARIPVEVQISSEYRYKNPIVEEGTLVLALSQSGETADTIAAVRETQAKGAPVIAICNVQGSTLAREADCTLFLRAGPEIGVASTKAFTSQLAVLSLFSLLLARMRDMSQARGAEFLRALKALPDQIQTLLDQRGKIQAAAKQFASYENFFYLGRRYMYPTALEGALKLKEIAYVNANGYPAGEMKHGPIALIGDECLTVACCANKLTLDKLHSNLMEIKARGGPILAIAEEGDEAITRITDHILFVPRTIDELAPILTTVVTQLLAYDIAYERGTEIDQPRNLAKSVTVE
jgi:glutamine---fructose-6-phosphate transaminase (isomerizing)